MATLPSWPRALRTQWREGGGRFSSYQQSVRVRYVFGTSFYEAGKEHGRPTRNDELAREEREHGDMIYVDGREKLPNVGVVTEKSAAFWLSAAATEPAAKWLCKCDDDTLVHVNRLEATLRHVESKHPDRAIYFGHLKWRGWDAGDHGPNTYKSGFRFQGLSQVRIYYDIHVSLLIVIIDRTIIIITSNSSRGYYSDDCYQYCDYYQPC